MDILVTSSKCVVNKYLIQIRVRMTKVGVDRHDAKAKYIPGCMYTSKYMIRYETFSRLSMMHWGR